MSDKTPLLPDDIFAEMKRLGDREYAEVGVPMMLVAEDLSSGTVPAAGGKDDAELARAFEDAVAQVAAKKGKLEAGDFASILELLSDRSFLDRPFSELAES